MSGYFPIIVLVQLVAVLVLFRHAEALECYETRDTCDKLTCLNKKSESPAIPAAEPCKRPGEIVKDDLEAVTTTIGKDLVLLGADVTQLVPEFTGIKAAVEKKVKDAQNLEANKTLCVMGQALFTIQLPSTTVTKTHIVRTCTTGETRCQNLKEKSSSGKIEFTMRICLTEGDKSNDLSAKLDIGGDGGNEQSGANKVYVPQWSHQGTSLLIGTVLLAMH